MFIIIKFTSTYDELKILYISYNFEDIKIFIENYTKSDYKNFKGDMFSNFYSDKIIIHNLESKSAISSEKFLNSPINNNILSYILENYKKDAIFKNLILKEKIDILNNRKHKNFNIFKILNISKQLILNKQYI